MRIHYLQHVPFESPANIVNWAYKNGHKLTGTHLYNFEAVPDIDQLDWLIVMGGPMNIYEESKYPWLKYEKKFIRQAIDKGKFVLGICLGAQLITDVLGGKVTKNSQAEIGWFPVNFNLETLKLSFFKDIPEEIYVFQWHNDTFSTLGEGCTCIASSKACKHQAFIYKEHVIGFQFHMESTEVSINSLIDNCSDDMKGGSFVQNKEEIEAAMEHLKIANSIMDQLLHGLEVYYLKQEK